MTTMKLTIQKVDGTRLSCVPEPHETIEDDLHVDKFAEHISSVNYYHRPEEKCWVIDFHAKTPPHPVIYYMKISDEMPRKQLKQWLAPMIDALKKGMS